MKRLFSKDKDKANQEKEFKSAKTNNSRKITFSRTRIARTASLLVFGLIGLSLLFNVIFFTKYQAIRNSARAAEENVYEKLEQVKDSDMISSNSAAVFTENFLEEYFQVPREKEDREERLGRLDKFFVGGFDNQVLEGMEQFEGERKLSSLQFVENERVDKNKAKLHFLANYEIIEIEIMEEKIRKEVKDKKGKKKEVEEIVEKEEPKHIKNTVEIVVPVVTDGKGFAVYDHPNLINRDLISNINIEETELSGKEITGAEKRAILKFLEDFFTSYGVSDEKLPYMAKIEKGLNDQLLQNVSIRKGAEDNDKFIIFADVIYQNSETSLNSLYSYELKLDKEKSNFFITHIN